MHLAELLKILQVSESTILIDIKSYNFSILIVLRSTKIKLPKLQIRCTKRELGKFKYVDGNIKI